MINIVNLTPHNITCNNHTFAPSGEILRVSVNTTDAGTAGTFNELPLVMIATGEPEILKHGQPHPVTVKNGFYGDPRSIYIVSSIVAQKMQCKNMVAPANLIRDENGNVTGCKEFAIAHPEGLTIQSG